LCAAPLSAADKHWATGRVAGRHLPPLLFTSRWFPYQTSQIISFTSHFPAFFIWCFRVTG
jgi:hypothetical protein